MKVTKAIIPAAGLGTRFLPATKAMPKEMLPVLDKPTIQYIVEEAVKSGIEEIIIVTGKGKRSIEDHFDNAFELEANLLKNEKLHLLEKVQEISKVDIHYIRQKEPKGLGHAIWCARKFIGNEPFAVLLGDDIVKGDTPCTKQLIDAFEQTGKSVIGVQHVPDKETTRYGIIDPSEVNDRFIKVNNLVEKPKLGTAPSNFAIMGRYVLTPEVFNLIEQQEAGAGQEIQLTDALQKLNQAQDVLAYLFEGRRYDVGEIPGFILTNVEFALERQEFSADLIKSLEQILSRAKSGVNA
ncbi:UTP--glucose-1-phosphate uridylyltransferase GalU [Paenibacillus sp. KS-LC4]|uniref:UTP--glucose-1-phosphate uridylyltransferase GalU n=1 Tax=Paenibacillus sp. KS-LC4 TaxID=2979727 RepID=UPI0030D514CD